MKINKISSSASVKRSGNIQNENKPEKSAERKSCGQIPDTYGRILLNQNAVSFGSAQQERTEEKIYYDEDFGSEIRIIKRFDSSGNCTVSRIEIEDADKTVKETKEVKFKQQISGKIVRTSNRNSGETAITEYDETGDNIKTRIEIFNDENGEPEYIVYSKASNILRGAIETTKFKLSDYPEDTDILTEIKANKPEGGEKLSEISYDGKTVTLKEKFENNGITTTRFYSEEKDENGNTIKSEYRFKIKGQDTDFETERTFEKNQDNTTTTTVNGKKFVTSFDDKMSTITIKDDEGNETITDFKKKLKILPPVFAEEFGGMMSADKFFDFLKEQPGDILLLFDKNVKKAVPIQNPINSGFFETSGILTCGANSSVMYHELGHSVDNENPENIISQNKELNDIYEEEFKAFKTRYPKDYGTIIEYFAPETEKGKHDGLSEIVAETNMLLFTYGSDEEKMQSRAQLLVRHFPKTFAKAAELITKKTAG